jgi:alkylation response protein AidB-like acyl-CoA dehydrogenase
LSEIPLLHSNSIYSMKKFIGKDAGANGLLGVTMPEKFGGANAGMKEDLVLLD